MSKIGEYWGNSAMSAQGDKKGDKKGCKKGRKNALTEQCVSCKILFVADLGDVPSGCSAAW
jgi:hypothetical protein